MSPTPTGAGSRPARLFGFLFRTPPVSLRRSISSALTIRLWGSGMTVRTSPAEIIRSMVRADTPSTSAALLVVIAPAGMVISPGSGFGGGRGRVGQLGRFVPILL
jgi:hypothetical protein